MAMPVVEPNPKPDGHGATTADAGAVVSRRRVSVYSSAFAEEEEVANASQTAPEKHGFFRRYPRMVEANGCRRHEPPRLVESVDAFDHLFQPNGSTRARRRRDEDETSGEETVDVRIDDVAARALVTIVVLLGLAPEPVVIRRSKRVVAEQGSW